MADRSLGALRRRRWFRSVGGQIALIAPALILVIAGFIFTYQFVGPAPPHRIVMATGAADGAYYAFGQTYAKRFAKQGIELALKQTAGSDENLALLRDPKSGVVAAFLQGGIGDPRDGSGITTLGSVYYEPLWVFVRGAAAPGRLKDLAGMRVAVGVAGSGTRAVALRLLADSGVTARNAKLLEIGGAQAAAALVNGVADAAIFVTAVTSQTIRTLMGAPGIAPMSFARADAYVLRNRFLSRIVLPAGTVDLAADLPKRDLVLVAPAATVAVSPHIHPALIDLLLLTMHDVHRDGGLLEASGAFPAPTGVTYPVNSAARRFYDNGPPFLQRFLPFWAANLIDRLKIMLLPLITLLYPLFKLLPPAYSWRMRSRISRWYKQVQALNDAVRTGAMSHDDATAELDRIDRAVESLSVPASHAANAYTLRLHIDFLRQRIAADRSVRAATESQPSTAAAPEQAAGDAG